MNRPRAVARTAAATAVLACAVLPASAAADPAPATTPTPTRASTPVGADDELLWLEVDDVGVGHLTPGSAVRWQIGAHLAGAPDGDLSVELHADGPLVLAEPGVVVRVDDCETPWLDAGPTCADTARTIVAEHVVVAGSPAASVAVGTLAPHLDHWLLVTVSLPESTPESSQGLGIRLGVGLTAVGDVRFPSGASTGTPTDGPAQPTTGPGAPTGTSPDRPTGASTGTGSGTAGPSGPTAAGALASAGTGVLARTGSDPAAALALGFGAVVTGLALAGVARRLR